MSTFPLEIELTTNSDRALDFADFAEKVCDHIDNYSVPQYGDKGEDEASDYTAEDCIKAAKKYLARYGRAQRENEQFLDLIKAAHYIQMAADKNNEEIS